MADMTTEHAQAGMRSQAFVWWKLLEHVKTVPGMELHDTRSFFLEHLELDDHSLNMMEKELGDMFVVDLMGRMTRIEVCSSMPGRRAVSVGESKIELCRADFFCFVSVSEDEERVDIRYVSRSMVHKYLDKAEWRESKTGGERYKEFYPLTFRSGYDSTELFFTHCLACGMIAETC